MHENRHPPRPAHRYDSSTGACLGGNGDGRRDALSYKRQEARGQAPTKRQETKEEERQEARHPPGSADRQGRSTGACLGAMAMKGGKRVALRGKRQENRHPPRSADRHGNSTGACLASRDAALSPSCHISSRNPS